MKIHPLKIVFATVLMATAAQADNAGFLTDYSLLDEAEGYSYKSIYLSPGALDRLANYDKVMIDQPEIFIDPESKYKGMKPDTMLEIAKVSGSPYPRVSVISTKSYRTKQKTCCL